jgi:MYM-type Zinc finger with FCS sequence motif
MGLIGMTMCHGCKKLFTFNPDFVPVVTFSDGYQGPVCGPCLDRSNEMLKEQGLPLLHAHPNAYDPGEI